MGEIEVFTPIERGKKILKISKKISNRDRILGKSQISSCDNPGQPDISPAELPVLCCQLRQQCERFWTHKKL